MAMSRRSIAGATIVGLTGSVALGKTMEAVTASNRPLPPRPDAALSEMLNAWMEARAAYRKLGRRVAAAPQGQQLALERQLEPEMDELLARMGDLEFSITDARVTTVEGMQIKARLARLLACDGEPGTKPERPDGSGAYAVAWSLVVDLLGSAP